MSEQLDIIKQWDKECKDIIAKEKAKVSDELKDIAETFQSNTLDNIPQVFGDFLYTALGDRVTGQRNSIINKKLFEVNPDCIKLKEKAEANGTDLETELIKDYKYNYSNDRYNLRYVYSNLQTHITTGRKFGVSYLTGNGDRVHTIYVGSVRCFEFLTQEHIDCIKNKQKKELSQKFLDFRDEFITGCSKYINCLEETPIPIKIGNLSLIKKYKKNEADSRYINDKYFIFDDIIDYNITHTLWNIQKYNIWDKTTPLYSGTVKCNNIKIPSFISGLFLNINNDTKTVTLLGNVDIDMENIKTSIDVADDSKITSSLNLSNYNTGYYRMSDNVDSIPISYCQIATNGYIYNLSEVLKNPMIKDKLKEITKFYNDMSIRLQNLKHNNATLYFLNGDI